jgi:hypothetical protein
LQARHRAREESHKGSIEEHRLGILSCCDVMVRHRKATVYLTRDMEMSFWIPILLCKTKVNDIKLIFVVADTHQKIHRLDIAVN